MKVTSPKIIKQLLADNGLTPLKKFGQNFLTDGNIVEKIAGCAAPDNSYVLEIGMGLGALTDALCSKDKRVISVEIDKGLASLAEDTQKEHTNLTIIKDDILNVDIEKIADKYFDGNSFYVCGNLPYYITAPIIMKVLESGKNCKALTAMVQKEAAQRLCAAPADSEYGAITAAVDYFGGAKILFNVSKNCFYPAPKVDSAVIQIKIDNENKTPFNLYRQVVKAAFKMRRKTIANNLKELYGKSALKILEECKIASDLRPQDLSSKDYCAIADALFARCRLTQ